MASRFMVEACRVITATIVKVFINVRLVSPRFRTAYTYIGCEIAQFMKSATQRLKIRRFSPFCRFRLLTMTKATTKFMKLPNALSKELTTASTISFASIIFQRKGKKSSVPKNNVVKC